MYCALLSVWTWSLLQFTFVNSSVKELPEEDEKSPTDLKAVLTSQQEEHQLHVAEANDTQVNTATKVQNDSSNDKLPNNNQNTLHEEEPMEEGDEIQTGSEIISKIAPKTDLYEIKFSDIQETKSGRCDCFCFYNETWSLVFEIIFQDGPFLIARVLIMVIVGFFGGNVLFFTLKNALVILLIVYRIKVIRRDEKTQWLDHIKNHLQN